VLERVRFARYALRFERAYKTDRWEPVIACFVPDAVYSWDDGEMRGAAAIAELFRDLVTRYDKKFDRRIPWLTGLPRVERGVLTVPWKATYKSKLGDVVLHGTSRCKFANGKIAELRDTMVPEEVQRWKALADQLSA
jgi:hypothetical protein